MVSSLLRCAVVCLGSERLSGACTHAAEADEEQLSKWSDAKNATAAVFSLRMLQAYSATLTG